MNDTTHSPGTGTALARCAAWAGRHRWAALGLWVAVMVALAAFSQALGPSYHNDISIPGSESQRVLDALEAHAPAASGESVRIVVHDPSGLSAPATRARIAGLLDDVRDQPHVVSVTDPFASGFALSPDRTTAYATVQFDHLKNDLPQSVIEDVVTTARSAGGEGLQVELGGDWVRSVDGGGGGPAEGVGLLAALVVLLLMFGSAVAAGLPLVTAVLAVGSTVGLVSLLSHWVTVASYTTSLMVLVGLGVGIDYALLVFSRFRAELVAGASREDAVRRSFDTAGRSVLFAGLTVIIALGGLVTLQLPSLQGLALPIAMTVGVTMLASLTLLPALLAMFGGRLERSVRRRAERADRSGRIPGQRWRTWSSRVRRVRWPAIIVGVAALVGLTLPVSGIQLGIADAGTGSEGRTSRAAYDLLAHGFGPGVNGPLVVLAEGGADTTGAAVGAALAAEPGVASVAPPQPLPDGSGALLYVIPTTAPQDAATADLVDRLRGDVLPQLGARTGTSYLLGGTVAAIIDFSHAVADRLPYFVGAVVGLSALLLMVVFGSLLIPVKAAVFNLLSIGASLGVVTTVFQQGWFGIVPGPVEAFVPVMIFAIVFGLSMDYEVFLVSRMHEEWRGHGDADRAITEGLAHTGGVITAAASIMVAVFASFLLSSDRMLQEFGLGLAVAVLLDALIIRCLLVPTVMGLFGRRAWWLPGPLRRVLPRVELEPAPGAPEGQDRVEVVT